MRGFTSILHPTDFSEASQLACVNAVELARQCGAKLTVLHVYPDPTRVPDAWSIHDPRPELEDALGLVAADVPDVPVERLLRVGTPAETIVEYAKRHNCDVIVMGTHGRTGLGHLLMGSVAEKVIRAAPCPVLVVPQHTAKKAEPLEPPRHQPVRPVIVV